MVCQCTNKITTYLKNKIRAKITSIYFNILSKTKKKRSVYCIYAHMRIFIEIKTIRKKLKFIKKLKLNLQNFFYFS